jgi:hypothetical protein
LDGLELKIFCTAKETITRIKRPIPEKEKIFARYLSDKGLISRIYKNFKKLNNERIILSINGQII